MNPSTSMQTLTGWIGFSRWPTPAKLTRSTHVPLVAAVATAALTAVTPITEFLSFSLGGREYGVDISKVQEIRGYDQLMPIEDAPAFVQGLVELRGERVPVIDLRAGPPCERNRFGEFSVMIVCRTSALVIGMVVDGVADIASVGFDQIAPARPEAAGAVDRFVSGVGSAGERRLALIDLDGLIAALDLSRWV